MVDEKYEIVVDLSSVAKAFKEVTNLVGRGGSWSGSSGSTGDSASIIPIAIGRGRGVVSARTRPRGTRQEISDSISRGRYENRIRDRESLLAERANRSNLATGVIGSEGGRSARGERIEELKKQGASRLSRLQRLPNSPQNPPEQVIKEELPGTLTGSAFKSGMLMERYDMLMKMLKAAQRSAIK